MRSNLLSLRQLRGAIAGLVTASVALTAAVVATAGGGAALTAASGASQAERAAAKPAVRGLEATGVVRWGSLFRQSSDLSRYKYVIVGRHDAHAAAKLPGLSLVYMSGTSIQQAWSTGVSYAEASAQDWLLKDSDGRYVMNVQYGAYVGDFGNPSYQKRFVKNVSGFMRATGVDGVFLDDIVAHPGVLTRGVFPAKYPTPEAWESAMTSFVTNVGAELKARGFYVLASAVKFVSGDTRSDTGDLTADFWRQLRRGVSALMCEFWLQNPNDVSQMRGEGSHWQANWSGWHNLVRVAQGMGVDFFAHTYGYVADNRAMRYLRSSFLLSWNGRGGALIHSFRDSVDPYQPTWVRQVGLPVQPMIERSPGVFQRQYTRGIVVVNTTGAPVTITLSGVPWTIGPTDALMARTPRK